MHPQKYDAYTNVVAKIVAGFLLADPSKAAFLAIFAVRPPKTAVLEVLRFPAEPPANKRTRQTPRLKPVIAASRALRRTAAVGLPSVAVTAFPVPRRRIVAAVCFPAVRVLAIRRRVRSVLVLPPVSHVAYGGFVVLLP